VRIGLLGGGTVGSAVVDLLVAHAPDLAQRLGEEVVLEAVVVRDRLRTRPWTLPAGAEVLDDAARVVDDPGVEIVVEAIGGTTDALDLARRVLARGGSLVTANKALVAEHGPALFALAREHGGEVRFEAAVGAAVPVVAALQEALGAARVDSIAGVLNGSTNFLLALLAAGEPLAGAVARARRLGYLEADASDDLDGHDAARKIAILASIAGGRHLPPTHVAARGLGAIGPDDLAVAHALGASVKLLGVAERTPDGFCAWVGPSLVPAGHPLAAVRGAANAVLIDAAPGGETLVAGQGAGGGPTAMALAGDLLAAAKRRRAGARGPFVDWLPARLAEGPTAAAPMAYVIRVAARSGSVASLERLLSRDTAVVSVVGSGPGYLAIRTGPLAPAEADATARRLGALAGADGTGPALAVWNPPDASGEPWWQPPAAEPLVAATREGVSRR